jgi:hypothetical protein
LDDFTNNDTIVPLEVCCTLEFTDRLAPEVPDLEWRGTYPKLAAWHETYCDTPSITATRPEAG